ncbi:MAG: ANTAR domain-containing protein [Ruminococcus sp.]|nr:ANTAR domain-containing protein [Ruminococcus sp.]MBQ6336843.1 ANTAR domain-containing protein [Ruminococcus sp.]
MALEQRSYRALIVSKSGKFTTAFGSLLSVEQFQKDNVQNAGQARRSVLEKSYDLVVVNAPLNDEFGTRLCMDISLSAGTVAVIFAPSEVYDEIVHKVTPHGVFVIKKPASQQTIVQSLSLLISARERLRSVEKKAGKAQNKLEEIRVVNRAKWLLIDNEDMSENDAHKYIEKAAMDAGITKMQAAQIIIEKYQ